MNAEHIDGVVASAMDEIRSAVLVMRIMEMNGTFDAVNAAARRCILAALDAIEVATGSVALPVLTLADVAAEARGDRTPMLTCITGGAA